LSYKAKQLDETLQKFFAEIRKKDGSEYEPDSLRVMLASLDRHLREKDAAFSIAKDIEFSNSRKALTSQDEELLWSKGVLGSHSSQSLIQTMWFLLTQHFGSRGCQEHHDITDDNGIEFVTYEENPTKTRQGGLRKKRRVVQPKIPEEMRNSGPFYLALNERPKTQVWYKRQRMGVNSINSFMKNM
ncbi:unnamed protein product, partial [Porites evermanni]